MVSVDESKALAVPGLLGILLLSLASIFYYLTIFCLPGSLLTDMLMGLGLVVILIFAIFGFTIVLPNEAKVLLFLGSYIGTVKRTGFMLTLPSLKRSLPLTLATFSTGHIKVNDMHGNPIEIGAVVIWRITDTAQASFNVDNYLGFVQTQSNTALRNMAAQYPYDSMDGVSLRCNSLEVTQELSNSLQSKLMIAGIVVEETRITHLTYAPEISQAMLKRQQAVALIEARKFMIENTLEIVSRAIENFGSDVSNDKKAELAASLLAVMISDKELTPVLQVGGR